MRIPEQKPIARIGAATETQPRVTENAGGTVVDVTHKDVVSTSASDEVRLAAAAVRRELGASHQTHLAAIESAVRNGTYRPDPRLIAEKILQSAALDAQISASLIR